MASTPARRQRAPRIPGADQYSTGVKHWRWAIRLLAPLGALVVEDAQAAVGALLVQEGGLWLAGQLAERSRWWLASGLFLAAYGLRVAIALPTHAIARLGNGNGALFLDDYTNDLVAEWLARIARGDALAIFPGHQHLLDGMYPYLLMGIYAVLGYAPLVPKLLNAALAGLCVVLVYEIARDAFRPSVALIAGVVAAVLPGLVVWSIVTLKEPLALLLTLVSLRAVQQLIAAPAGLSRASHRIAALVALVAALAATLDLRSTTAAIVLVVALVGLVGRLRLRTSTWQAGLGALALVVVVGGGLWAARSWQSGRPPLAVVEDVGLQLRHRRAQEAAGARSQIRDQPDVLTARGSELPQAEADSDAAPFSMLDDVLDPLGYALLAPAPWQVHNLRELAAGGEMPIWYALLGGSLLAWRSQPRQRLFLGCLVLYGVASWLVLAASEGNLGNLLRHRIMLAPTVLVFGAAGLDWLWAEAVQAWPSLPLVQRARVAFVGDSS